MEEGTGIGSSPRTSDSEGSGGQRFESVGAVACLGMALMYVIALLVYLPGMRKGPAPVTVVEWFHLLETDSVTGLFYLGLADVVIVILFGLAAFGLRQRLSRISRTWTTVATAFAFVGIAVYLSTNVSLSMLSLSTEYSGAATAGEKAEIVGAAHGLLSITRGTGGASGLGLTWIAGLVFSILMLRTRRLGKVCAWVGIPSFVLLVPSFLFAGYTYGSTTAFGSAMALLTNIGGGLLSFVWYVLVGVWLLRPLGSKA